MGQALKSPLRIPALDHGIAESVDDLVVGTDDSGIAAKSLDQCWLVVDAARAGALRLRFHGPNCPSAEL
jgi:hypothetical protein